METKMDAMEMQAEIAEQTKRARKFLGGFSEYVFTNAFIVYAGSKFGPFGYLGSSRRTAWKDQIIERALIAKGLDLEKLISWLTSTEGRHMMDELGSIRSKAAFEVSVQAAFCGVLERVTCWSHPEHCGSYGDSVRLHKKLYPWLSKKSEGK